MKNDTPPSPNYSLTQKILAFSVHIFTSTGLIAAILAIIAISDYNALGDEMLLRKSMFWLFVAFIIDSIDGTFARAFKTPEILPNWDGKSIDYVVDFATYAIIPAFFIYESGILPEEVRWYGIISVLLVSALYYGKNGMVSPDMYFIGFPVMWNMVAFMMYFVTDLDPWLNFFFILFFSVLHFVPIKYPYPSQMKSFQKLNIVASVLFFIVNVTILYLFPKKIPALNIVSFGIVLYFGAMSLYATYFYKGGKTDQLET